MLCCALCIVHCALFLSCKSNDKSIVILYENDVHCVLDGYARLRGLADAVVDTAYVGITCSGDFLHGGKAGAISEGTYVTDIMERVDYDAVALGNHEFDFGMPRLRQLMDESRLPVVCHNLRTMQGDTLLFSPYIIKEYGETRIAFIGFVTPESMLSEAYSFFNKQGEQLYDLWQDEAICSLQETINNVRARGADYVILLAHLGEASAKDFITSPELISITHGIDVVFDGHTHSVIPCDTLLNEKGEEVLLTQTGNRFANVGKLLITPAGKMSLELIPTDSIKVESALLREVTDSIEAEMAKVTTRPVCHSEYSLSILDRDGRQQVRYAENTAGNITCDAFRAATGAQLALCNGGGIRTSLSPGYWTEGDIIDMLPYNNYLRVLRITGATLMEVLHATTANSPQEDGQFPQISGFRFRLNTAATGKERISDVEVLDDATGRYTPLDLNAHYTLCTTDYCVDGGGFYGVLRNAEVLPCPTMLYNQALITYLRDTLQGIAPEQYIIPQGRIVME